MFMHGHPLAKFAILTAKAIQLIIYIVNDNVSKTVSNSDVKIVTLDGDAEWRNLLLWHLNLQKFYFLCLNFDLFNEHFASFGLFIELGGFVM